MLRLGVYILPLIYFRDTREMIAEAFPICGPILRSNSLGVFTTTTGTDHDDETTLAVGRDATVLATLPAGSDIATFATLIIIIIIIFVY